MDNISMQFHDCLEATAGNNFVIINILTDGCCLDNVAYFQCHFWIKILISHITSLSTQLPDQAQTKCRIIVKVRFTYS